MRGLIITAVTTFILNLAHGELTCNGREEIKTSVSIIDGTTSTSISSRKPAGICFGSYQPDPTTCATCYKVSGKKYVCKQDGMYLLEYWNADCNGDPKSEELLTTTTYQDFNGGWLNITYRCDLNDCNYIKIRPYEDTGDDCDANVTPTITSNTLFTDQLRVTGDCNTLGLLSYKSICNDDGTAISYSWGHRGSCNDPSTITTDSSTVGVNHTTEFTTINGAACAETNTYSNLVGVTTGKSYYYVWCGTASSDGSGSSSGGDDTITTTMMNGDGNGNGNGSTGDDTKSKGSCLCLEYLSLLFVSTVLFVNVV